MSKKRAPGRSLDEWRELVIECRQSGLTDAASVSYTHLVQRAVLPPVTGKGEDIIPGNE